MIADLIGQQSISNFPREHGGVLLLIVGDRVHHLGRRHLGLGAADHARLYTARLVVPVGRSGNKYRRPRD